MTSSMQFRNGLLCLNASFAQDRRHKSNYKVRNKSYPWMPFTQVSAQGRCMSVCCMLLPNTRNIKI